MFNVNHNVLEKLCEINSFPIPSDQLIFFGLRGASPVDEDNNTFQAEATLALSNIDYTHLNCTLLQWNIGDRTVAAFPASTVPHKRHVEKSLLKNGVGTNQLMTGVHKNYKKGHHKAGKPTGHEAFRMDGKLPVRRTGDDMDYDEEDRVEFTRPFDNIHASWCPSQDHPRYASAGCQVIMGFPKCAKRGANSDHTGPWKVFHNQAYAIPQSTFTYILLNGRDARKVSANPNGNFGIRLRYGSKGNGVNDLQKALASRNYYEGGIDGDFGSRTLFALLDFQTDEFGMDGDDGIVGPMTAGALGIG
ncbi:MAG: peptidoglycan-binding domain-containing protein [Bacteroidota bacterium]